MIIALSGNMGVGKDTVADELVRRHGFRRTAFAQALKDLAQRVFQYDHATLWGPSALRNEPDRRAGLDSYWLDVEGALAGDAKIHAAVSRLFPTMAKRVALDALYKLCTDGLAPKRAALTPRYVLQRLGTEWGRALWPEVWLHAVKSEVESSDDDWVITDCRFANEAEFVHKQLKGRVVWVDAATRVPQNAAHAHASEPTLADLQSWVSSVLDNNGPIEGIAGKVEALLKA